MRTPYFDKIIQKYGIDKELTNLFIFELENNIFIYSSKDKDFYKNQLEFIYHPSRDAFKTGIFKNCNSIHDLPFVKA